MVKRRGELENGKANGDVRAKKPRMKWTDELHQSFLDVVATLGGEDCVLQCSEDYEKKQVVEKINKELHHLAPQQRQPRLHRIKELIVGNALENHHCHQHHPSVLESSNNVVTVHRSGEEGQRPHIYLIFGDIINPSPTQAECKGTEKMPIEDYHPMATQFYEKLVKKSQYNWASFLKLGIN